MRAGIGFALAMVAGLASFALPAAAQTAREIVTTQDSDYLGFDLRTEKNVTLDQCKAACLADPGCKAFTFNTRVNWCFLKSDFDDITKFAGAVAGKVVEKSKEADLGAPPALPFITAGTLEESRAMSRKARKQNAKGEGGSADEAMDTASESFGVNDPGAADRAFRLAAARDPDNARRWLEIARRSIAWLAASNNSYYPLQETATSAAIAAYELTRTASERAEALAVMAQALERRSQYRAALEAYKASLELKESTEVAAEYRKLKEAKGFRITGHDIAADEAVPSLCVNFSENLVASGVDYGSFVTLDGKANGAIEASGSRICAEGLEHGATYRLTLRAGLPSSVGEALEEPVVINAYVRDREPTVRFTGDNFILPDAARRTIPIVGINASLADLRLYRVGERALAGLLSGSKFLSQLEGYSANDIENDIGELVWSGKIELQREANRETVTAFPVDEALPNRKPGVYALVASVAGTEPDEWESRATQWFLVSDIGLTTLEGNDGLTVFARSLNDAAAMPGVAVELVARNNEILGSATTDAAGKAVFAPGLMRGAGGLEPTLLSARAKKGEASDFVFLDLQRAGFDLSDRGVAGRETPGPIDLFGYLDRGIYRVGETVHVTALARDGAANAAQAMPMTFIFRRPDGVEAGRTVSTEAALGAHQVSWALQDNAMRGVWHVAVHADPQGEALFDKAFLVEDFLPDRTEFDLTTEAKSIGPGHPAEIRVAGRYLYGAPAADLLLAGEMFLKGVRERADLPGYQFGLADEEDEGDTQSAIDDLERTDENGKAAFEAAVKNLPATTRPLEARIVVRMSEDGGRAVERELRLPVAADGPMIGIKPEFKDFAAAENSDAQFLVVAVDPQGKRLDLKGLKWSLHRIDYRYQWYREDGSWKYEGVETPRLVANGVLDAKASDPVRVAAPVEWGRYRFDVESSAADGPATSVLFNAGWYVVAGSAETPDALEIALDKPVHQPGDTALLAVNARNDGRLLVTIGAERVLAHFEADIRKGANRVEIPVGADWGAGAYVTASLYRPGAAEESRLPHRAIGVAWLGVDPASRKLAVSLDLPEKIRPGGALEIPVAVAGAAGREAYVTVAAVDVGILNLTSYKTPDPASWFFGQRMLGLEIRDMYGRLIDGSQGVIGKLRNGGDAPELASKGNPPKEKLLALFSGVVRLDADGKAKIAFDIPQFNGTARVMAVAWTADGVGSGSADVVIRDPVVLSASLPRVLAPGDEARTVLEIHNTDGEAGDYALGVESDGVAEIGKLPARLTLAAGERKTIDLVVKGGRAGGGKVTFSVKRGADTLAAATQDVFVRPATLPVHRMQELKLAANGSIRLDRELLGESIAEGSRVSVSVSRHRALDIPALLTRLDRYPYGCAEQTTSRALPLLYLSELNAPADLIETPDLQKRIAGAVDRVLSYQAASGAFGLWSPAGEGDLWLDSYVTDFLTRAIEKGHAVPEQAMRLALQNLQNTLAYEDDIGESGNEIAYALYVLARNRMASAGDLRYYADQKLDEFKSPLARAHLASALALYNEVERSSRAFSSALDMAKQKEAADPVYASYGSALRDGAALLALASEARPAGNLVKDMVAHVEDALASRKYTSTQEDAWLLLAARAVQEANKTISLSVNGKQANGALNRAFGGERLVKESVAIKNLGKEGLVARIGVNASPREPLPAGGEGFAITRTYYGLDGEEVSTQEMTQNERYVVVLEVEAFNDWPSHVLVSDLLPGGLEIDNPNLVKSADLGAFDWLPEIEVAHTEFRDDRFVAALERGDGDESIFQLAYVVRAVTPGTYVHPAASVEDMYRPELSARTATGMMEVTAADGQ
jgi:uncharacterized protein YfaS (alpha-2-macroglobulin family)